MRVQCAFLVRNSNGSNMNINDFNGTIPDGKLNQPEEPDWGRMENDKNENSCDGCKWFDGPLTVNCCLCVRSNIREKYEPKQDVSTMQALIDEGDK